MPVEQSWSDNEWARYLAKSSDPDDQSLSARLHIVAYLKTKRVLNQREEQMLALLTAMNKPELDFLRESTEYRIQNDRPTWSRWHWPDDLRDLYREATSHGHQR